MVTAKRYFGVELEIDEGGKNGDNADTLLGIGNRVAEHIYIKSDGSLSDGMEIVTHPMSLRYHKDKMPWAEIMRSAIRMDYRSHKTSTCGLTCPRQQNSLRQYPGSAGRVHIPGSLFRRAPLAGAAEIQPQNRVPDEPLGSKIWLQEQSERNSGGRKERLQRSAMPA